jgi:hypothetical protein
VECDVVVECGSVVEGVVVECEVVVVVECGGVVELVLVPGLLGAVVPVNVEPMSPHLMFE